MWVLSKRICLVWSLFGLVWSDSRASLGAQKGELAPHEEAARDGVRGRDALVDTRARGLGGRGVNYPYTSMLARTFCDL